MSSKVKQHLKFLEIFGNFDLNLNLFENLTKIEILENLTIIDIFSQLD